MVTVEVLTFLQVLFRIGFANQGQINNLVISRPRRELINPPLTGIMGVASRLDALLVLERLLPVVDAFQHLLLGLFRDQVEGGLPLPQFPATAEGSINFNKVGSDRALGRGQLILGLYRCVPLTERSSGYHLVAPDTITLYQGPIELVSGGDYERIRAQVKHTVIHEIAHHFGISDDRLRELGAY